MVNLDWIILLQKFNPQKCCPTKNIHYTVLLTVTSTVRYVFVHVCCIIAGATAYKDSYFGRGTGGIFLDNLYCTRRESRLVDCRHSGIGVHNCDHSADAGLRCQGISSLYLSIENAYCDISSITISYFVAQKLETALLREQFTWGVGTYPVRAEWRYALEDCGEQCVTIMVGALLMLVWSADN